MSSVPHVLQHVDAQTTFLGDILVMRVLGMSNTGLPGILRDEGLGHVKHGSDWDLQGRAGLVELPLVLRATHSSARESFRPSFKTSFVMRVLGMPNTGVTGILMAGQVWLNFHLSSCATFFSTFTAPASSWWPCKRRHSSADRSISSCQAHLP